MNEGKKELKVLLKGHVRATLEFLVKWICVALKKA